MTDPDAATCDPVVRGLASRFVHLPPAMGEGVAPHYAVADPATAERATLRAWPHHTLMDKPGGGRGAWIAAARAAIEPATRIRHEHLVRVTDVGLTHDLIAYLQMEAVDGPYLREFALPAGGAPAWRVAEVVRQAAEGLAAVHAAGLVHGALTPDSLVIDGGPPRVRLLDLGLSALRAVDPSAGGPPDAAFTAPEVVAGLPPTVASDVYSLAAIAHAMLAGAGRHAVSPGIMAVLAIALEAEPARRFASVRDFATALEGVVHPSATPAPLPAPDAAAASPRRSGLRYALVGVGSIAAVALLGLLGTWTLSGPGTEARDEEDVAQASIANEPESRDVDTAGGLAVGQPAPATVPTPPARRPGKPRPPASRPGSPGATAIPGTTPPVADSTPSPRAVPTVDSSPASAGPTPVASTVPRPRTASAGAGEAARAQAAAAQAAGRLAQAVETRDLAALTAALPELTPDDRTGWEQLFEVARDVRADLKVSGLEVRGAVAEARISGAYEFQNRSINRRERLPVAMQATLVRESGRWRIQALR